MKATVNAHINELCEHGLTKSEARIVLSEYLGKDRVGHYSHGTSALPNFLKRLKERKGPMSIIKDSGPVVYIDGCKELGQLVAEKATEILIKKTRHYGIGLVGIRDILPFSSPGTYVKKLADKSLFGLGMIDGGRPMVAHPNSYQPVIGTNPIAFAFPTSTGSLVVDMATSKKAWGEVRQALLHKTKLPPQTYKNKLGRYTRDPKQAFSVVPFGDYKGFALGMMVEILCGSFLGMKMGKHKPAKNNVAKSRSAIFIAINPSRFVSINKFKRDVTLFIKEIKSSKRNKGVKLLRIPGESTVRLRP
jgi:L-2-hydroxycarboxylate dehydrogenase (NAD+)